MPDALPPDIQIVTTTRGMLYELPAREVGCLRSVGVAFALVGLIFVGSALVIVLIGGGVLGWLTSGQVGGGYPLDVFKMFLGVPFLLFGFVALRLGGFLMGGRSTIELRGDTLIVTQGPALLRLRRKIPIEKIHKFQVKSSKQSDPPQLFSQAMSALNVKLAHGKLRNVTWGYPKDMLRALAEHLTEKCETLGSTAISGDQREPITIEERTVGDGFDEPKIDDETIEGEAIPPRPENAASKLELRDDGLTITIPPVGIRKGSKGLFGFSVAWCLFMTVFTGGWIFAGNMGVGDLLFVLAIVSVFWAVGLGTMLAAINAGRRRAILDVVGDTLLITRQNIFKTRQQEVRRDNIESIRRDASGTKVNDVPLLNLQVRLHEGKKISMLGQLSNDELAWIASELRQALEIEP